MMSEMRKVTGTNLQYRKFPMPRFIILSIAILLLTLPLISPCSTMAFTVKEGGDTQKSALPKESPKESSKATPKASPKAGPAKTSKQSPPSAQREVVNIFVDKIEDGAIYSKDGREFRIGSTKVIDNSRPATKMKAAELSFVNGELKAVILK